jgi:glutamate-1-semialdehyde 2,1-aminomutase
MTFDESRALRPRFHALIPGGAHTYAKGDDQYPEDLAPIIARGAGCHVWDVDGNEYIEYGMGLRAVTLGHAYGPVVEAVERQLRLGENFVRPARIELTAAEDLLTCVQGAEMVKFAKNGSDVTTAAVRLARGVTGRDLVALPIESTFLSVDDWYIGTTPMATGVPEAVRALTVRFHFNDLPSAVALFDAHPGRIACVVLEAATSVEPAEGFLAGLKELCHNHGAVLIFDEMITGFRWHLGGAQAVYGVQPDLATFGKALGNGFAVSALAGRRDLMDRGGLQHAEPRIFLLSNTHGAEAHGLAAAIAVMHIYREEGVVEHLYRQGSRLATGVTQAAEAAGVSDSVRLLGRPCNLVFQALDAEGRPSQSFRTLFMQELIGRGVLAPSFVVSYSHSDADIDRTVESVGKALQVYRRALDEGIARYLPGRPVKPVMRERN